MRSAHPCKKRKDGAASSRGHPWSRSARVGQPPLVSLILPNNFLDKPNDFFYIV
jgi:hypothetical protein